MTVFLFDHERRTVFKGSLSIEPGEYRHPFGGSTTIGTTNLAPPLHFLFGLNTDDPYVRQVVPNYEEELLPVFFGFAYPNERGFVYRCDGDAIEIRSPRELEFNPVWFGDGFPEVVQSGFLDFAPDECNLDLAMDALDLAAIFGLDDLSDDELQKAIEYVRRETDLFEMWSMLDCSDKQLLEFAYVDPFWQWKPSMTCRSRNWCGDSLRVIAILNPDVEIPCDGQIIVQHCQKCGCFTTSYQCT